MKVSANSSNLLTKKQNFSFKNSSSSTSSAFNSFTRTAVSPSIQASSPVGTNQGQSTQSSYSDKLLSYIACGAAVAALGIVTFKAAKDGKSMKVVSEGLQDLGKKITGLDTKMSSVEAAANKATTDVSALTKSVSDVVAQVKEDTLKTVSSLVKPMMSDDGWFRRKVTINDKVFNLTTVLNSVDGVTQGKFQQELRAQSARHILGLTKPLAPLPGQPMIRVVSAELKPFTSVGGLSSVPKEVAEELPKILRQNMDARIVLDTPMYTGRMGISNGIDIIGALTHDTQTGKWSYNKIVNGKAEKFNVDLIDEFTTKIAGGDTEQVRLFQYSTTTGKIKFDKVEGNFTSEQLDKIKQNLPGATTIREELKSKVLGAKQSLEELAPKTEADLTALLAKKQDSKDIEEYLKLLGDFKKDLENLADEGKESKALKNLKAFIGKIENLKSLKPDKKSETLKQIENLESLKQLQESLKKLAEAEGKLQTGVKVFEAPGFVITKNKNNDGLSFQTKVTYNLWDNKKFNLDTPLTSPSLIYSNAPYSSGLEERVALFNRYIYEHTLKMNTENAGALYAKGGDSPLLRADGFVLNDWLNGSLAAMFRYDTVARKYHGALEPEIANRLRDIPIMSLLHNNGMDGFVSDQHQVEKLLNIMFGQYAAQIAPEAYAVNTYNAVTKTGGINYEMRNTLMRDTGISPLNMMHQLSDFVIPVSKGYANEVMSNKHIANGFDDIIKLRAKVGADGKALLKEDIIAWAKNNGIDNVDSFGDRILASTFEGIDNGLNRSDKILNSDKIDDIISITKAEHNKKYLPDFNTLMPHSDSGFNTAEDALAWKTNNKKAVLNYYRDSITNAPKKADKSGDLNVWVSNMTDLSGITENTPVFVTAGRIDKQKGYETYLESIEKYIKTLPKEETDFPVFQLQGQVLTDEYSQSILKKVIEVKENLKKAGYEKAANRIVFLDNGQDGKYSVSKLMADFNVMASTFEPCGLTHKEFMNMSGAVAIGHNTGGITAGLQDDVTGLFIPYDDLADMSVKTDNLSKLFKRAVDTFKDKNKYAKMVQESLKLDFTWVQKQGEAPCSAIDYVRVMERIGMPIKKVEEKAAAAVSNVPAAADASKVA